jgi:hypothetical protein
MESIWSLNTISVAVHPSNIYNLTYQRGVFVSLPGASMNIACWLLTGVVFKLHFPIYFWPEPVSRNILGSHPIHHRIVRYLSIGYSSVSPLQSAGDQWVFCASAYVCVSACLSWTSDLDETWEPRDFVGVRATSATQYSLILVVRTMNAFDVYTQEVSGSFGKQI